MAIPETIKNEGIREGPDGNLYGGAYGQDILYRIDKTSGHLTAIANSNITYFDFGSTLKGLYAVDTTGNLYSINYQTAKATLVGPTGVPVLGGAPSYWGMSSGSSTLLFSHQAAVYGLSLTTGAATLLGTASFGNFGAEVFEHNQFYAANEAPLSIDILAAKGATALSTITAGTSVVWGLAPIQAIHIAPAALCSGPKIAKPR